MLRHPKMTFANFDPNRSTEQDRTSDGFTIENITTQFDPSLTWNPTFRNPGSMAWIPGDQRADWPGRRPKGAPLRRGCGASVQPWRPSARSYAPSPVAAIKPVREATADNALEIFVDSGVRHGADVATALALGAQAALRRRPHLYGLAVAQERGVDHVLQLLRQQLTRTMQLLGVRNVSESRGNGARSSSCLRKESHEH